MKKNIINIIIIIIGFVLLTIGISIVISKTNSSKEKLTNLDINSELVLDTYKKIPKGIFDYKKYIYYSVYKDTRQTYDNLSKREIIESVLYNITYNDFEPEYMPGNEITTEQYKLSKNRVETEVKNIFGNVKFDIDECNNNLKITERHKENNAILRFNALYSDQYKDESYYFYEYYDESKALSAKTYSQITKATLDEKNIYIYDKYLAVVANEEKPNELFNIYFDNKTKTSETLDAKEFYNENISLEYIEKLKTIKAYTYLHTFEKIDDKTYVWKSTEVFEK